MSDTAEQEPAGNIPGKYSYWPATRRLTAWLLASWLVLTFGILFFARELAAVSFFGWSLPFYMAAQGLSLFYVLILSLYSLAMRRIERDGKGTA
ncbi:MAG: sodium/substrate symporter small subunit [Pseudomonadota bacterium]